MASSLAAALARGLEKIDRLFDESEPERVESPALIDAGVESVLPGAVENPLPPRLSILLPALNEEGGIRKVMHRIPRRRLQGMGFDLTVQLLDGGSSDLTREVARRHGAEVYVQKGWGKGSAFRQFLPTLQSSYCVILDSDATYPPSRIPDFARALRDGAPVVVGSRFKGTIHDGAMTASNRLGNKLLSRYASFLYGVPVSDVCSGMWGFRTDVLKSFEIHADGFDLEANLFAECVRRRVPIVEIAIPYYRRIGPAKLRVRTGFRIAWSLFHNRIRFSA